MGSVKDLHIIEKPTSKSPGEGVFTFSDRYSVFDWGEMPDVIPGKGESLNIMSAYNFMELEKIGIKSHFKSIFMDDDVRYDSRCPSDFMRVDVTNVIPIDNGYEQYDGSQPHYLIPLEIIFRNGLPKGSSIFSKLDKAKNDPGKLIEILG